MYLHPKRDAKYNIVLMCYNPTCTPLSSTQRGGIAAVLAGHTDPHTAVPKAVAASAEFVAVAEFPSIILTDVQRVNFPKTVLWDLLGLSRLNGEFQSPLNDNDVKCIEMEKVRRLTAILHGWLLLQLHCCMCSTTSV